MCTVEAIVKLKAAILEFLDTERDYAEISVAERRTRQLAEALNVKLDLLRQTLESGPNPPDTADEVELSETFHVLGALAESGDLRRTLSEGNARLLRQMLNSIKEVGLAEAGLRKKDLAGYLRNSGDTDLLLQKQQELEAAAKKKDGDG